VLILNPSLAGVFIVILTGLTLIEGGILSIQLSLSLRESNKIQKATREMLPGNG